MGSDVEVGQRRRSLPVAQVEYVPHERLEVFCRDELAPRVVSLIQENAHTGLRGDGKIYVSDLVEAVRISTGERGEVAV